MQNREVSRRSVREDHTELWLVTHSLKYPERKKITRRKEKTMWFRLRGGQDGGGPLAGHPLKKACKRAGRDRGVLSRERVGIQFKRAEGVMFNPVGSYL